MVSSLHHLARFLTAPLPEFVHVDDLHLASNVMTCGTMDTTATIMLYCWIYGKDAHTIFSVEIAKTETVGTLKEVIKEENPNTLRAIEADALYLYSIPSPSDEDLEDVLMSWDPRGKTNLKPRAKLSTLSPESDETEQLIIVCPPCASSCATRGPVASTDMTLHCWIRGLDFATVFPVEISSMETVGALRETIREEHREIFDHVGAFGLSLYTISIPRDRTIKDVLGHRTTSSLGSNLDGSQRLSAVFTPFRPDDQLHLIIEGPLIVRYLVRGQNSTDSFKVKISLKDDVDDLKSIIKSKVRRFGDVEAHDLKLYKIRADDTAEMHKILDSVGSGELMQGYESLRKIFNDVPFSQIPHVVVEPPDPLAQLRRQYAKGWARNRISPSVQGEPSQFKALQSTELRIEWTRPSGGRGTTIPVTLLHPVFGQFVDDCQNYEPTSEDNSLALELHFRMCQFFDSEKRRRNAIINILRSYDIRVAPSRFYGHSADRYLRVNSRRFIIFDVKNEVGSQGAEPYCQAILYYVGGIIDKVALEGGVRFNFPCIILTVFGPHIGFAGAVFSGCPNYQVLSTVLPLFSHPTDTTMRRSTARHMGALRKTCDTLDALYDKFDDAPAEFKDLQPEFPYPRSYTCLDGVSKVPFKYIRVLEGGGLLFVVETSTGMQLCAKFVRTYSRAVHQQCAEWEISPSLKGYDELPGGWKMIVMDLLEDYECFQFVRFSDEETRKLREELESRLKDLHRMKLVHGDVRGANIMVNKDRSWMLVDFDWSGEIGKVRYPMNVNRAPDLRRPEGAIDGELILAEHDMEMLGYVF